MRPHVSRLQLTSPLEANKSLLEKLGGIVYFSRVFVGAINRIYFCLNRRAELSKTQATVNSSLFQLSVYYIISYLFTPLSVR